MITLYGIPNCETVKKARTFLDNKKISYHFHNYKTEGIDLDVIESWLRQVPLHLLFNKSSATWRNLSEESKEKSTDPTFAKEIMKDAPTIIKRPIVVDSNGNVLAVGFKMSDPFWSSL